MTTTNLPQQVLVTNESGNIESGYVIARSHGSDNTSVLVRFADRTECWMAAFRVRPA